MIRSLRYFFLRRAPREKFLLMGFIAIGLLWWGSAFTKRAAQFTREQRITTTKLKDQAMWIRNRVTIETKAQQAAAGLDHSRTLNANQLAAAVEQVATQAGLRSNASSRGLPLTTTSGQFSVHTLEYQIAGADWDKLKDFYERLQRRAPYIAIDTFSLNAAPNNPALLTVVLRVASVEIIPDR